MIRRLRGPLAWTLAVEGAGVLAGLLTLRLAALAFTVDDFGGFILARRLVGVAAFPLLLGFGIALPRAVARAEATAEGPSSGSYAVAAGGLSALSLGLFALLVLLFPIPLATLTFGTPSAAPLVLPTLLAIVGIALHTLGYAWYRGRTAWTAANVLQILAVAAVPPLAVTLAGHSITRALAYTGLGWGAVGVAGICAAALRGQFQRRVGVRAAGIELLGFGLPRIPGEVALFGLLALPGVMVAHREGLAAAGYVSLALSLVQLAAAALAPVGTLLLPIVSREAALGNWAVVRRVVRQFLLLGVGAGTALAVAIILGAPLFIRTLLGEQYLAAVPAARVIALAAIPYAAYLVLRNPLDAIATHPHNSRNLLLALLGMWLFLGPLGLPAGTGIVMAYSLLGILSGWDWWRLAPGGAG